MMLRFGRGLGRQVEGTDELSSVESIFFCEDTSRQLLYGTLFKDTMHFSGLDERINEIRQIFKKDAQVR